jgi:hypothetical protein
MTRFWIECNFPKTTQRNNFKSASSCVDFIYLRPYREEIHPLYCNTFLRNSSAQIRALALRVSFMSLISLSISSMKLMTKSTSLCLYICSVLKFVIRKLMSYPCTTHKTKTALNKVFCCFKRTLYGFPFVLQPVFSSSPRSAQRASS